MMDLRCDVKTLLLCGTKCYSDYLSSTLLDVLLTSVVQCSGDICETVRSQSCPQWNNVKGTDGQVRSLWCHGSVTHCVTLECREYSLCGYSCTKLHSLQRHYFSTKNVLA